MRTIGIELLALALAAVAAFTLVSGPWITALAVIEIGAIATGVGVFIAAPVLAFLEMRLSR
jgi:hypothetical protein